VFRTAKPLKDPNDGEILGYEAQYLGRARLIRSEGAQDEPDASLCAPFRPARWTTPATRPRKSRAADRGHPGHIDIVSIKEEIRAGDRLLPEPPRQLMNYVPRAPQVPVERAGWPRSTAARWPTPHRTRSWPSTRAARRHRARPCAGHPQRRRPLLDTSDGSRVRMKLPDERNGLLMVFRCFDRVSYALILEIKQAVRWATAWSTHSRPLPPGRRTPCRCHAPNSKPGCA
jgi:hypothetical protein